MKRRWSFVVDLTSHFDNIQLENGLSIFYFEWSFGKHDLEDLPWLSLSDYQNYWTFGQVANLPFYSHLVLMGPRTGLWRTVTLLTSFTTKIQRKKIQQLLVQLLVVARLWTVSFHFPSQPIRTPVSSNSICSKSSMVHQTLVTKVPFWNQVGTFGWNMALFVNQCQTCCSLNSIR